MNQARQLIRKALGTYLPLVPFLIFALFPVVWMLISSFKSDRELYDLSATPFWISKGIVLAHYRELFFETSFVTWISNSFQVSILATAISLVISVFAAYALVRLRFPGAAVFAVAIFVTYLVPHALLFLPMNQVVNFLGLADSKWALVVTYPTFLVPFSTWLIMGYLKSIPKEIEEAALIDGCSRIQVLFKVVIPIAIPGIMCATLFSFTLCWNEFLYALTFISSTTEKMAPVGVIAELIRGDIYFWGALMAGAITASLPIVFVYVFFLDYFMSGLTSGATKG